MSGAPFVRLTCTNDWGWLYLTIPHDGRRLKFADGDSLHVQWPDGSVTAEKVTHKPVPMWASDMGRESRWEAPMPGVAYTYRGLPGWVRLEEVMVRTDDVARCQERGR